MGLSSDEDQEATWAKMIAMFSLRPTGGEQFYPPWSFGKVCKIVWEIFLRGRYGQSSFLEDR